MGAISAATVSSLQRAEPPEHTRAAMQRAAEIAMYCLHALNTSNSAVGGARKHHTEHIDAY